MIALKPTTSGVSLEDALRAVAINSSCHSSRALSKWFSRHVRLDTKGFECIPITSAAEIAGPPETVVAAIHMPLTGDITGDVLLAIPEEIAFKLADCLLGQPPGTANSFGDLECSSLEETANIVGTSFANCLAQWLNVSVIPHAPTFAHDLSCAVVDPLLLQQAAVADEAWISRTEFEFERQSIDWRLLLLLSPESVELLRRRCASEELRDRAMHAVVVNAAFSASHAMSKWLNRTVRPETSGFERVPLATVVAPEEAELPVAAFHSDLNSETDGHHLMRCLLTMPLDTAGELVGMLLPGTPASQGHFDEMACSCLQETASVLVTSFANTLAKWLDLGAAPTSPEMRIDLGEALLGSFLVEQAAIGDDVLLAKTTFHVENRQYDCRFYLLPTPASVRLIETFCR
ncbi:MAG: hypothetical protein HZB38_00075 [Planctomycetes bacterium]|nr:hypothetical protein [Planctomycetota bacterium]